MRAAEDLREGEVDPEVLRDDGMEIGRKFHRE
jgi:hypothetical protein